MCGGAIPSVVWLLFLMPLDSVSGEFCAALCFTGVLHRYTQPDACICLLQQRAHPL